MSGGQADTADTAPVARIPLRGEPFGRAFGLLFATAAAGTASAPVRAGRTSPLASLVRGVAVDASHAYLAAEGSGLRVVDAAGHPPGYLRAFVRALLGACGVLAAGLGLLPMMFDPARRAFHDRLFRTRVIKG